MDFLVCSITHIPFGSLNQIWSRLCRDVCVYSAYYRMSGHHSLIRSRLVTKHFLLMILGFFPLCLPLPEAVSVGMMPRRAKSIRASFRSALISLFGELRLQQNIIAVTNEPKNSD